MTAGLLGEARRVGSVLASVWRVCGWGGWIGAGLLCILWVFAASLLIAPQGVYGLPGANARRLLLVAVVPPVSVVVVLLFWMRLVVNVMQQNHPQLARTLPGQVRALRTTLIGFALLMGSVAALFSAILGGPLLAVLAAVLAVLTMLAAILRWPLWGFGVAALCWSMPGLLPTTAARLALRLAQDWAGLAAVLVVALALWVLAGVVIDGGLRHAAVHRRVLAMAGAMRGDFSALASLGKGDIARGGWLGMSLGWVPYRRWLRWVLQRPGSSVQLRLALGLGPRLHWTSQLSGQLVGGIFLAVLLLLVSWSSTRAHAARGMGMQLAAGLPLSAVVGYMIWPSVLWSSRREQALLRLLPGALEGATLNRWLARDIALKLLFAMLLASAVCVSCIRHYDLDFEWSPIEDFVLGSLSLSPWILLTLWRDWSTLKPPTGSTKMRLLAAALGMAAVAWVWVGPLNGHWWTLACSSALLFAPLGYWRWRLAVSAPVAWPVGRASAGGPTPSV